MVSQDTTYAIDAEFAFMGPIAFDVGKFIANLLLAFFSVDGHATAQQPRTQQRQWLLQVKHAAFSDWTVCKPIEFSGQVAHSVNEVLQCLACRVSTGMAGMAYCLLTAIFVAGLVTQEQQRQWLLQVRHPELPSELFGPMCKY